MKHPRYLAILPSEDRLSQSIALIRERLNAGSLRHTVDSPRLLLFSDTDVVPLPYAQGWLIGRRTTAEATSQKRRAAGEALADLGCEMLSTSWGEYVACLQDANDGIGILRDPSGAIPCYYFMAEGALLVTSGLDMLELAGLPRLPIAWDQLLHYMRMPQLRPTRTALSGLSELVRGGLLTLEAEGPRQVGLWKPETFSWPNVQVGDRQEASTLVRRAVLHTVAKQALDRSHILLGLSGGLDSSIVAAALLNAGAKFTCLTLSTKEPAGDERPWARQVAQHVGAPLIEAVFEESAIDVERSGAAHLPWPLSRSMRQHVDMLTARTAAEIGADAHFGGAGGDNVFCYLPSASLVVDRLLADGPGLGALQTANDLAEMTGASVWTVLRMTIARLASGDRTYRWEQYDAFLAAEWVQQPPRIDHPWLGGSSVRVPGKAGHVAQLLQIEHELEALGSDGILAHYSPLMAQPVVEACLRVPSWMWIGGGINRSIARDAFDLYLPKAILERRLKGAPDGFSARIFDYHRSAIRTLLGDGLLRRHGLLAWDQIDAYLQKPGPVSDHHYIRLLMFANVEAWARARCS